MPLHDCKEIVASAHIFRQANRAEQYLWIILFHHVPLDINCSVISSDQHLEQRRSLLAFAGYSFIATSIGPYLANPRSLMAYLATLKRKWAMSPSLITYSFPSRRSRPFLVAAANEPHAIKSSKVTTSARIKPRSMSE